MTEQLEGVWRTLLNRLKRRFSQLRRRLKNLRTAEWESKHWRLTEMPSELTEALAETELARGARILDIGCGTGEISAWLADAGFSVVAIEQNVAALAVAKREHMGSNDLQYLQFDFLAGDVAHIGQFDAAVDRGCLHQLGKNRRPGYVTNLVVCLRPGALFCLFHRFEKKDLDRHITPEYVTELFSDAFDVVSDLPHRFETRDKSVYNGRFFLMRRKAS